MASKKSVKKNKKSKEKLSLKQEYKKSWKYLKETKNYLWIIAGIFLIMALVGFFIPAPEFISESIMKLINEIIGRTKDMTSPELIAFIISNNVQTSFLGMIFGFVLGIFPIITTIINGYILGFVSALAMNLEGGVHLLRLIPHGIFELPAIIISLGLGLKLGDKFIEERIKVKKKILRISVISLSTIVSLLSVYLLYLKSIALLGVILFLVLVLVFILIFSNKVLKLEIIKAIRVFLLIILPLLLIAGIIEGLLIFLLN